MSTKARLEINIINTEKLENFKVFKRKVKIAHSLIGILFLIGVARREPPSIFEILGFSNILQLLIFAGILIVSFILLLTVYRKTPSSGKLYLTSKSISILSKKRQLKIQVEKINSINIYISHDRLDGKNYTLELFALEKNFRFDLDLIFRSEIESFMKLLDTWESIIPLHIIEKESKSEQNSNKLIEPPKPQDLAKNIKIFSSQTPSYSFEFPIKVKSTIPYRNLNKNQFKEIVIETIETLNWNYIDSEENQFNGFTDSVFSLLGDEFSIDFETRFMILKVSSSDSSYFPIGCKERINTFITKMAYIYSIRENN